MKRWLFVGFVITTFVLIPLWMESEVTGEDAGEYCDTTIYVGSFHEIEDLKLNVGNESKYITLTEKEYATGYYYGEITVKNVEKNTRVSVIATDSHNGTSSYIDGSGNAYLWITNYSRDGNTFSDTNFGQFELADKIASITFPESGTKVAIPSELTIYGKFGSEETISVDKIKVNGSLAGVSLASINVSEICSENTSGFPDNFILWKTNVIGFSTEEVKGCVKALFISDSTVSSFANGFSESKAVDIIINGNNKITNSFIPGEVYSKTIVNTPWGPLINENYTVQKYAFIFHVIQNNYDYKDCISHFDFSKKMPTKGTSIGGVYVNQINFHADVIKSYNQSLSHIFDTELSNVGNLFVNVWSTGIGDNSLSFDSTRNVSIFFKNDLKTIGCGALKKTNSLRLTDLSTVEYIGDSAFEGSDIKVANLSSIRHLGVNAFKDCKSLDTIVIGQNITNTDLDGIFTGAGSLVIQPYFKDETGRFDEYRWYPGAFGKLTEYSDSNVTLTLLDCGESAFIMKADKVGETLTINKMDNKVITRIFKEAFRDNLTLKSITFENTIQIDDSAFENCSNLSVVSFNLENSLGNYAFKKTAIGEIDLSKCKSVGIGSFEGSNIKKITGWNDGLNEIPNDLFKGCHVSEFPSDMVTWYHVGENAFSDSNFSLKKLTLGKETLDDYVGANGLGNLKIDELVLKSLGFSKPRVTPSAFDNVHINKVKLSGGKSNGLFADHTELTEVSGTILNIGDNTFQGCTALSKFDFSNVTNIGRYAFQNTGLTGELVLSKVTVIGAGAFQGCDGVTKIKLTGKVTVSADSFDNWGVVESDSIVKHGNQEDPDYVTFGNKLVLANKKIKSIAVPENIDELAPSVFEDCIYLTDVSFAENSKLSKIGAYAFRGCTSLGSLKIPNSVSEVGDGAFMDCTMLNSLILPDKITIISKELFKNTTNLKVIDIPSTVKTIGVRSFEKSGLTIVDLSCISDSVGTFAFKDCIYLSEVKMTNGDGTTCSIPDGIFEGCTSLNKIVFDKDCCEGDLCLVDCSDIGTGAFSNTAFNRIILESVDDLIIGASAFSGMDSLEDVRLKGNIITIGAQAFENCIRLQNVTLESEETIIGTAAFKNCSSLGSDDSGEKVVLDLRTVSTVSIGAFYNCIYLGAVEFSSKLIKLDPESFKGCVDLRTIEIRSNQTYTVDENGLVVSGTKLILAPTGLESIRISKEIDGIESPNGSVVLSLLRNLKEIQVEAGGKYACLSGCLVDGNKIILVPNSVEKLTIDVVGKDLELPYGIFKDTAATELTIRSGNLTCNSNVFTDTNFKRIEISAGGSVTINADVGSANMVLDSFTIGAEGEVKFTGGIYSECVDIRSNSDISYSVGVESNGKNDDNEKKEIKGIVAKTVTIWGKNINLAEGSLSQLNSNLEEVTLVADDKLTYSGLDTGTSFRSVDVILICTTLNGTASTIHNVNYYVNGCTILDVDAKPCVLVGNEIIKGMSIDGLTLFVKTEVSLNNLTFSSNNLSISTKDGHQHYDLLVSKKDEGGWNEIEYNGGYSVSAHDILWIKELEAKYDDSYVKVTFDTGCDMTVPSLMVVKGRSILNSQLPELDRVGYSFEGWYTSNSSIKYSQAGGAIDIPTTLHAKWTSLGNYVDLINVGGSFSIKSGTFTSGQFNDIEFTPEIGFEFIGFKLSPSDSVDWEAHGTKITINDVSGYVAVIPEVRYVSLSADLTSVIGLKTVSPNDDLILEWAYSNNPKMVGNSWSGTPGTPLIVDGYVYLHLGPRVYKLDIETGREVASSESEETNEFYNHIGFGGSNDKWYVLDYASGKVLDDDLNRVMVDGKPVSLPSSDGMKMKYAKWHDGYFYTVFNGNLWKMSPSEVDGNGMMKNLYEAPAECDYGIFSQYGITSSVLIIDDVMYWLSTDEMKRIICYADLSSRGKYLGHTELSGMKGYFMDDGWLTYYNGYIYTTGYTTGLFGDNFVGSASKSKIAYMKIGTNKKLETLDYADVGSGSVSPKSLLSGFVVVEGRGYLNATVSKDDGGYLMAYDIAKDGEPKFKEAVKSDASHGGIVVSTADLNAGTSGANGDVNIYLMNYDGINNSLYIITDHAKDGTWTLDSKVMKKSLNAGYGSQAIRVDTDGRIIFYNDSGALYCYAPASLYRDYYFFIEGDNEFEVVTGEGNSSDPYAAIGDALFKAKGFKPVIEKVDGKVQITFGNTRLYAYYYNQISESAAGFESVAECGNLKTLRNIYLMKADSKDAINPDMVIHTVESSRSGTVSDIVPIKLDGVTVNRITTAVSADPIRLESTDGVKWSSSDSNIVRISSDGELTAVSMGSAWVTAETSDGKSTCMVSVSSSMLGDTAGKLKRYVGTSMTKYVTCNVSFDLDGGTLNQGSSVPESISYEIGTTIKLPDLTSVTKGGHTAKGWWDGESLYDSKGKYVVSGTVTICPYWVADNESEITSIDIVDSEGKTYKNGEYKLVATKVLKLNVKVSPSTSNPGVQWSSDNPDAVSVKNGVVTALAPGTAKIEVKALYGDASASFVVVVPGYDLLISDSTINMKIGDEKELTASYEGEHPLMGEIVWSSDKPGIATAGLDGKVVAVSPGSAVITAKAPNGNTAMCVVTVSSPQVTISGAPSSMEVGQSKILSVSAEGITSFQWSSSNPAVVVVDTSGKVTAVSEGYAVISVNAKGFSDISASVTIAVNSVKVTSVSVSGTSSMNVGDKQTFIAKISPSNAHNTSIVWSSSNPAVASVTSNGVVMALSKGVADITATSVDGVSGKCTVTVKGTVTSISVDQTTLRIESGKSVTLKATTAPDESTTFGWTTSDSKVATVYGGKVTGVSPGTATITVKYGDLTATCLVTVYKNSDVKTDTKDNGDGTTTVKTEETISSGSSDVKKVTEETKDKEDKSMGSETKVNAQSKDGKVKTEATVKKDSSGNITESTVTTTITAESKSSNGKQTFTVSEEVLLSALDQIAAVKDATGDDVDTVILIDTSKGTASESQATLPSEALSIMAENKDAQLQVRTSAGTIEISSGVMSKLSSDGKDVKLGISKISENEIPAETKGKIGDAHVFELSASSGDTQHHTLGGKVVVTLPYALDSGKNGNDVRVYHMDDTGNLVLMVCKYNAESGSVSFATDHFSYFVVSDRALLEEAGAVTQSDSGLEGLLTIVIALLAVLIVLIAAAFVLYIRNNNIHL